jgi:hypothetical protein
MEYLIFIVICGSIFGYLTKRLNEKKGYEGGFWLGFILGVIGLIIVACKEEKRINFAEEQHLLATGGWKCYKCGTVNPIDKRVCRCGVAKQEHAETIKAVEEARAKEERKEESEKELHNLQKLKAYKDLLDSGAITQEEFDKKKAELL